MNVAHTGLECAVARYFDNETTWPHLICPFSHPVAKVYGNGKAETQNHR